MKPSSLFAFATLLSTLGCFCGGAGQPTARIRYVDASADDRCAGLFDYCIRVYCTVVNQGDAPGTGVITYQFARDDGRTFHGETTVTLQPGETKIVPYDFAEAKLLSSSRYSCAVN